METYETLILVVHVIAALSVIGLVLIQRGKGADMGSGFGGGSSSTVFGSSGAGNFLTRLTTGIAITFFVTSFGLAFYAKEKSKSAAELGIPTIVEQATEPGAALEDDAAASEIPSLEPRPEDDTESEVPEI